MLAEFPPFPPTSTEREHLQNWDSILARKSWCKVLTVDVVFTVLRPNIMMMGESHTGRSQGRGDCCTQNYHFWRRPAFKNVTHPPYFVACYLSDRTCALLCTAASISSELTQLSLLAGKCHFNFKTGVSVVKTICLRLLASKWRQIRNFEDWWGSIWPVCTMQYP